MNIGEEIIDTNTTVTEVKPASNTSTCQSVWTLPNWSNETKDILKSTAALVVQFGLHGFKLRLFFKERLQNQGNTEYHWLSLCAEMMPVRNLIQWETVGFLVTVSGSSSFSKGISFRNTPQPHQYEVLKEDFILLRIRHLNEGNRASETGYHRYSHHLVLEEPSNPVQLQYNINVTQYYTSAAQPERLRDPYHLRVQERLQDNWIQPERH